jgi:hypothetical protein
MRSQEIVCCVGAWEELLALIAESSLHEIKSLALLFLDLETYQGDGGVDADVAILRWLAG